MEKLPKGRGDSVAKEGEGGGVLLFWVFSCGVASVTTVNFNYILVIVFLFPLNVGVTLFSLDSFSSCLQGVYFLFP